MNLPIGLHPGWIVPDWPVPPRVRAFVTTRAGGVSAAPYDGFNLGTRCGDDPAAVSAPLYGSGGMPMRGTAPSVWKYGISEASGSSSSERSPWRVRARS